jgi:hypothetical protein
MNARISLAILSLSALPGVAHAGLQAVPEPGVIELLAIAAAAGIAVAVRNRRKK